MNERKLPCVNTILLNRYMKKQDWEAARDEAIVAAQEAAMSAPVTPDDVYEFGCLLEMGGKEADAIRLRLARMLTSLNDAKYTREAMAELVGYAVMELVNENRAQRAEQKFWEEQ